MNKNGFKYFKIFEINVKVKICLLVWDFAEFQHEFVRNWTTFANTLQKYSNLLNFLIFSNKDFLYTFKIDTKFLFRTFQFLCPNVKKYAIKQHFLYLQCHSYRQLITCHPVKIHSIQHHSNGRVICAQSIHRQKKTQYSLIEVSHMPDNVP